MPIGIYKRKPLTDDHKRNIGKSLEGHIPWNKNLKTRPLSDKHKEKLSRLSSGRKVSELYGDKVFIAIKEKWKDSTYRQKQDESRIKGNKKRSRSQKDYIRKHPEFFNKIIKNGCGTKCYSNDGLYFPSLGERDCYYWSRDDVEEVVEVKKFGRFDLILTLINGDRVVLEYHPNHSIDRKTSIEYYNDRRKLLDELGYKDLKLVVMTGLKEEEKERVNKILRGII